MSNFLSDFSDALGRRAEERRLQHASFNAKLAKREPILFEPHKDDPTCGFGWFLAEGGFVGYGKYANGYDPDSRQQLTFDFIRALAAHLPPA